MNKMFLFLVKKLFSLLKDSFKSSGKFRYYSILIPIVIIIGSFFWFMVSKICIILVVILSFICLLIQFFIYYYKRNELMKDKDFKDIYNLFKNKKR